MSNTFLTKMNLLFYYFSKERNTYILIYYNNMYDTSNTI